MSMDDDFPYGINYKFAALFFGIPLGIMAIIFVIIWLAAGGS